MTSVFSFKRSWALWTPAVLCLFLSLQSCGGSKDKPDSDEQSATTSTNAGSSASADKNFGVVMSPDNVAKGKASYQTTCAPCHGTGGKGDGPASAALNPKPRDHTNGAYMDTLTNEHIFTVIKQGGAAFGYPTMPAQPALADDTVRNIIAFVRSLSPTYKQK